MRTGLSRFLFGVAFLSLASNAWAEPPALNTLPQNAAPVTDSAGDPPARVGRVSLLSGTVSFHTADQDAWSPATGNYPVVSGDAFWTEPGSRAEIQTGNDAMRLDGGTEVEIGQLDDQGFRIEVTQGTVNLHVGDITQGEMYQIVTPQETVNILQPGTYRINSGVNNVPDEVAVLKGQAQVGDANGVLTLAAGETAVVTPGSPPAIALREAAGTPFDNWSLARDNYEEPRQVMSYVSPEMTGYEDLDNYGNWQTTPDYGAVWVPSAVPVGWAPYRYGHWVWVSPWGWTWVDDAPWGFAPFHYGRWAYAGNHWCWVPGAISRRPVYAPALVAFVGGDGWSVSVGAGERPVGWFPLGPNEIYRPGYRVSHNYIRNVNITNVRDVTRITNVVNNNSMPAAGSAPRGVFANQRFATVVGAKDFGSRHMERAALNVPPERLTSAPVNATAAPPENIEPRTEAQRGAGERMGGDWRHNETRPAIATPAAPQAPAAPTVPAIHTANPVTQPHEENALTPQPSPGPPIRHHDMTNAGHAPMTQGTPQQPVPQAQRERASHEIRVQHPVQTAPLTPSHEGWVRREPQARAPQQTQHQGGDHGGNDHNPQGH